jgi:hypothetical protein
MGKNTDKSRATSDQWEYWFVWHNEDGDGSRFCVD